MAHKHVMLDKETLAVTADAVIMSIGACRFDLESQGEASIDDTGFYASISIDSNLDAGRRIDESTLIWWMKQSPEAQGVFTEPKQSLESALIDFVDWFGNAEFIWANGADFDTPMLAHALRHFGIQAPWTFGSRCVRTYKNLPGMKSVKPPHNPLKHNALQDAITQAKHVQAIHAKLSGWAQAAHPMVKKAVAP